MGQIVLLQIFELCTYGKYHFHIAIVQHRSQIYKKKIEKRKMIKKIPGYQCTFL